MKYLPFLTLGLIFASCMRHDISPVSPVVPELQTPNEIYVSGFVDTPVPDGFRQTAAYWKNGQKFELPGGSRSSYAYTMAVAGNDVYVAGFLVEADDRTRYVLWKNGEQIDLEIPKDIGGEYDLRISALKADNTDIYACGSVDGKNLLWRNGAVVQLADAFPYIYASPESITISGNDVYVNGGVGYWLNGVFIPVKPIGVYNENEDYDGVVNYYRPWIKSIQVFNNDIYFAGSITGQAGQVGGYMKNSDDFVPLPHASFSQSEAVAMEISEGNVYIVGKLFNTPMETTTVCWKNGQIAGLISIGESEPSTFVVYKNQALIVGNFTPQSEYGGSRIGAYWICTGVPWMDYQPTQIPESSVANAIFAR